MPVPEWILNSPLRAGIQTMEAGGRLGLAARAQDAQEREAADRLGLSMQEMQARREQAAAALAESLRQHNAMEQYRQQSLAATQANQNALRQQAQQNLAATLLNQNRLQGNWTADHALRAAAENRLEDAAQAESAFESGNAVPVLDESGNPTGFLKQKTSRGRVQILKPPLAKTNDLTPSTRLNALLRIAAPSSLANADVTDPLYSGRTNALALAKGMILPQATPTKAKSILAKQPPKDEAAAEASNLIQQYPDKEDAIRARYKATYGEDL